MDILNFINSKDIREYLQGINYKCDSMQAAWLVYQSANKTMEEKHAAYHWIIENMPDCSMPERRFAIHRDSLHAFLQEHINFCETHKHEIDKDSFWGNLSDDEQDLYRDAFESRWFCFPTPFKKGDLVHRFWENPHRHRFCGGVFVLNGITNTEEDIKRCVRADESDMNAYGWYQTPDGQIYHEVMHNYMDLVKFTGELYGQERILIALSNFLQDKIGVELLLQAQRTLMMRDYGEDDDPNWYTDEGLELAGLANIPKLAKAQKRANRLRRRRVTRYFS